MLRHFILALFIVFPFFALAANAPSLEKTWEDQHADQPYIALLSEYDTQLNPDFSTNELYHSRIKIQKDVARDLGEWPVYYNKSREEIISVDAFVETPDGKRYPSTKSQDLPVYDKDSMYSDMMVKMITLPQVNVGSIIDVLVKSKVKNREMPKQFWDEVNIPVIPTKYARTTYAFPESIAVQFKPYKTLAEPRVERGKDTIKYSYIFENTGYMQDEEFMPPTDEALGKITVSTVPDWKDVADWYRNLINRNSVDEGDIALATMGAIKDKTTQKDKARAILEFIQDNFRYVSMSFGDHTVEPHLTKEIFKNRYGDCKDLALLARQMLSIAEIKANIALFSGEFNGNPQNGLPSPKLFDHVVLEVEVDGEKYFIDPMAKGFDFGQLPPSYDNAYVLVIEELGYRFQALPVAPVEQSSIVSRSKIKINPDGSAIFDVTVKLPIEASQSFKQTWQATTDKDKFYESLEASFAQGGKMISRDVKGIDQRYGQVEFTLKYESPSAYPVVNDMILLKENDANDIPDFASRERHYDIFVPSNSLIQNTNIYEVPDGFAVDFIPPDYDLSVDFSSVSAKYIKSENSVSVTTELRLKRALIDAKRYKEVQDFRKQLYSKNDQYIVLKRKTAVSDNAKEWVNK